jgi:hypothetical protein
VDDAAPRIAHPVALLALLWIVFVGRGEKRLSTASGVEEPDFRSGPTHTYRDPDALRQKVPLNEVVLIALSLCVVLVVPALLIVGFAKGFTSSDRIQVVVALGIFLAIVYLGDRRHRTRVCGEIRLSDEGTCELQSKRKVIRLHVNQIESVERIRDPDSRAAYAISYRGGGVLVGRGMTGFGDFLTRLEALNPGVDLSGFPPAWGNRDSM